MALRRALGVVAVLLPIACAGSPPPAPPIAKGPPKLAVAPSASEAPVAPWLRDFPGLFVRRGDAIVSAPEDDVAVAKGYARASHKGALLDGHRLTLLTRKERYRVGEEIRVLHVHEIVTAGEPLYLMGPKPVRGEYLDGRLVSPTVLLPENDEDPFVPEVYDGVVATSPGVDYNYEITVHRFSAPAVHVLRWRIGRYTSNELRLEIVP